MKYVIEKMESFSIIAAARTFRLETCMAEIPKFWDDYYAAGNGQIACGQFGVCLDCSQDGTFRYAIGNACETAIQEDGTTVYRIANCAGRTAIPAGFELIPIPAHTWLKVECRGPLPQSVQSMYPVIERDWPQEYVRVGSLNLEEYSFCASPEDTQKDDYLVVIWIPVKPCGA